MNYRRRFDARDFRWAGPEAADCRDLEYVGLAVKITIPMHRAPQGDGYRVGRIDQSVFRPADHDAFVRCGGLHNLEQAALLFANGVDRGRARSAGPCRSGQDSAGRR